MTFYLHAVSRDNKKWFTILHDKGYQIECVPSKKWRVQDTISKITANSDLYIEINSLEQLFTMCDDIKTEIIIEPDGEAFYGDKALLIYDDYIEQE